MNSIHHEYNSPIFLSPFEVSLKKVLQHNEIEKFPWKNDEVMDQK